MFPTVIKELIKQFVGYDFKREYLLAVIRLIGRKNRSPCPSLLSLLGVERIIDSSEDHLDFQYILSDLTKYCVDLQTIHGSAFVSKQMCNIIIHRRGSDTEKVAEGIFESIMKVPNRVKVSKHTIDCTRLYICNISNGGMNLSDFDDFDFDLNRRYQVFKDTYALNF